MTGRRAYKCPVCNKLVRADEKTHCFQKHTKRKPAIFGHLKCHDGYVAMKASERLSRERRRVLPPTPDVEAESNQTRTELA